ncbi:MAG: hypothetical protein K6E31_03985 [bacterium]|nr:hypothetical protein [bacterium]
MLSRTENTNSKKKGSAVTLSRAEKIQMSVAAVILVAAISGLLYFVYAMPTVIKVVPLQQAHENVAAAQRALILEQELLKEEAEARRQQQAAAGQQTSEPAASPETDVQKQEPAPEVR